jgi:hypothetical protein
VTDDPRSRPLEHRPYEVPSKSVQHRLRAISDADKEAIVARLLELWKLQPRLRLGQLLASPYLDASALRGVEDELLIEDIEQICSRLGNQGEEDSV